MSFFLQSVSIPMWFLIMMNVIVVLLLAKLFWLVYRFNRGEITKEEHSDMVVWTVRNRKRPASPNKLPPNPDEEKEREKKEELVQVLKVLLKEGDKGVLMQTIADRMGTNIAKARHAMDKLVDNKMVDEVVGVSGTKFYLTQQGKDYCRSKARQKSK
jgi:predicted transcriptional regulator